MTRRGFSVAALLFVCLVGGGVIGYALGSAARETSGAQPPDAAPPGAVTVPASFTPSQRDSVNESVSFSRRNAITRVAAAASPAVVGINVVETRQVQRLGPWGDDPFFRYFFGDQTYTQQVPSLGSGFIISADGYVLTNDHVAGNASKITVTLTSGEKYEARLVGSDMVTDIAVLKIEGKNLPFLRLGDSEDVIIGEWVIALGNPFGLFDIADKPTVTVGVVSATDINLRASEGRSYRGMIQTDAAINSGNSGGPLLNTLGEVIGVNSVIYTPNQGNIGLGFAIPINRVKAIAREIRETGKVERAFWTGLEITPVDRRIARYFGLPRAEGVIVSDVAAGSPAEKAGFRPGDIILEAKGEKITTDDSLITLVNDSRTGDVIPFRVLREKKSVELKLKLEKRPG